MLKISLKSKKTWFLILLALAGINMQANWSKYAAIAAGAAALAALHDYLYTIKPLQQELSSQKEQKVKMNQAGSSLSSKNTLLENKIRELEQNLLACRSNGYTLLKKQAESSNKLKQKEEEINKLRLELSWSKMPSDQENQLRERILELAKENQRLVEVIDARDQELASVPGHNLAEKYANLSFKLMTDPQF